MLVFGRHTISAQTGFEFIAPTQGAVTNSAARISNNVRALPSHLLTAPDASTVNQMTPSETHADALKTYLSLLEKNAINRKDLSLKKHFAQQLISFLKPGPLTPATYRVAVDAMLDSLPGEYSEDGAIVARELFPCLMSDVPSVVAIMRAGGYRGFTESAALANELNVRGMHDLIALATTTTQPSQRIALYKKYQERITVLGGDKNTIAVRCRIAKVLLHLLRDKEITPVQYRSVVDVVMPLLAAEDARQFFVHVAREFYHFLADDPNAGAGVDLKVRFKSPGAFG